VQIPPFFCSVTETARDIAEDFPATPIGSLPEHPLEDMMLPPSKWPEEGLDDTCKKYLHLMEVYVDDFCTIVQTSDVKQLRHLSRSLLHAIHKVFPLPSVSGLAAGDPIYEKKLLAREGLWGVRKEILGWVFDGARRVIEIPSKNIDDIIAEVKDILRHRTIPFKRFQKVVGRLRHAAIGLPAGRGLCAPFNRAIAMNKLRVVLNKGAVLRAVLTD